MGGALAVGGANAGVQRAMSSLNGFISEAYETTETLVKHGIRLHDLENERERARWAVDTVLPEMAKLRDALDNIEGRMDAREFPFPSYQQMLFHKH